MAVNYASKYAQQIDERFRLGALTAGAVNSNYDWMGVQTVKVYSVPTVALNDYSATGTNRYGTPSELSNNVQELTVTKDRSFSFTIDRASRDDTQMAMDAGAALQREIDEVILPEIDTYRLGVLDTKAGIEVVASVTKTNAYAEFLAVQEKLDDANVPASGRICYCTAAFHNKVKLDESYTKRGDMATQIAVNGVVGEIDGVPVVKVPSTRMPEKVDFIITNPLAMPSPIKLENYVTHEDPPGISGWLVEGRVRYDAFVLNEKQNAVGTHRSVARATTSQTTESSGT